MPHEPIADVLEGNIIQVAAGHTHSAALMEDGTVWTWGDNLYDGNTAECRADSQGRYGLFASFKYETNQPAIKQVDLDNVLYIAAGKTMTAAIQSDGSLWTWGYNAFGALGNGIDFSTPDEEFMIDSKPYKILEDVESVSLGDSWGLALKKDGTLWTWGHNQHGILANGAVDGHSCEPVKIMDDVTAASAGAGHCIALKKDGTVWALGDNRAGQLSPEYNQSAAARPIKVYENAVQVFAGYAHSSITEADGTPLSWGDKSNSISDELTNSVIQVSMYSDHLFMLKEDGTVWARGKNEYSQLGDGTTEKRDELVLIYSND